MVLGLFATVRRQEVVDAMWVRVLRVPAKSCNAENMGCSVASSCVCTSPLAVMTVVGLLHVVTVSNSAEFKSFLPIMCIDAPESTTNSLSSCLRIDGAGRHQFCEGEKNAALFSLLILTHFWPASTLLHGHLALAIVSLPETDPQFLESWGYAGEDHLGKSFQAMDFGLECQHDVRRLLWILHIGLVSVCLSSSTKSMWRLRRLHILIIRNRIVVWFST